MGIAQIPGQLRRAPTLALRVVFAGIGRVLMAADRPEASATSAALPPPFSTGGGQQSAASNPEAAAAAPGSRWRSLDETGNVRLLPIEEPGDDTAPAATELPLARYDELSLASIRARLRSLNVDQLRVLANYERRNAERPEVVGMLERRIEKLEAGE
jgi:hypothetical protein